MLFVVNYIELRPVQADSSRLIPKRGGGSTFFFEP